MNGAAIPGFGTSPYVDPNGSLWYMSAATPPPFLQRGRVDGAFLFGLAGSGYHTGDFVSAADMFYAGAICIEGICSAGGGFRY